VCLLSCRWYTRGIESHQSDLGEYGEIQPAIVSCLTDRLLCRLFDVSKQVVGQLFVHSANLLVSGVTTQNTAKNACVSYFLNILIDTTFGEPLIIPSGPDQQWN